MADMGSAMALLDQYNKLMVEIQRLSDMVELVYYKDDIIDIRLISYRGIGKAHIDAISKEYDAFFKLREGANNGNS